MSAQLSEAGDCAELETLFDSIALVPHTPGPAAKTEGGVEPATACDSNDLEDLFDSIAMAKHVPAPETLAVPTRPLTSVVTSIAAHIQPAPGAAPADPVDHTASPSQASKVINSVGQLTRQLHDTLAELGYDRHLQDVAAGALPDARQRIAYVVTLTEQAATRCLSAVELATPVQAGLASDATALAGRWDGLFHGESDVAQFKQLAQATRDYLRSVPERTEVTRAQLREVMMAQEFQDLTGQVLKRVTELANTLETQLLKLLVENAPAPIRNSEALNLLNGPQINGGAPDVVANQAQVDDLLESLGF